MFGFDDIIGIGAGLLGGFLQNKGGKEQQQAAQQMSEADKQFYREQYERSLSDNRANQSSPFGSLTWEKDPTTGKWTQTTSFNPAEQARLDDFRQIAADRMASAKGMSANFPQGAINWDALGLGKIASAAGIPGGGSSDATADARAGKGIYGMPGFQRQNPLIGGNGQFMSGPMGRPTSMPMSPMPSAGGQILGGQAPGSPPPGPANLPGGRQPYTPAPITPTPTAPGAGAPPAAPTAPQAPQIDPNAAANFQAYLSSGHNTMSPEMYDHFGGDEMLKYVKTLDPNAKFSSAPVYGGEGGMGQEGKRLDFDPTILSKLLKGGK